MNMLQHVIKNPMLSFFLWLVVIVASGGDLFFTTPDRLLRLVLLSYILVPIMLFMLIDCQLLLKNIEIKLRKNNPRYYYSLLLCLCFLFYYLSRQLSTALFSDFILTFMGLMLFIKLQLAWLCANSMKLFWLTSGSVTFFLWLSCDSLGRVIFYCFPFSVTVSLMISYMTLAICFWRLSPGYRLSRLARGDQ